MAFGELTVHFGLGEDSATCSSPALEGFVEMGSRESAGGQA